MANDGNRGQFRPRRRGLNVASLIPLLGRHPIKRFEAALGCSPRQARRIVDTGKAPSRYRAQILGLTDKAIAHVRSAIAEADAARKAVQAQEMVDRAKARRAARDAARAAVAEGQTDRPEKSLLGEAE